MLTCLPFCRAQSSIWLSCSATINLASLNYNVYNMPRPDIFHSDWGKDILYVRLPNPIKDECNESRNKINRSPLDNLESADQRLTQRMQRIQTPTYKGTIISIPNLRGNNFASWVIIDPRKLRKRTTTDERVKSSPDVADVTRARR